MKREVGDRDLGVTEYEVGKYMRTGERYGVHRFWLPNDPRAIHQHGYLMRRVNSEPGVPVIVEVEEEQGEEPLFNLIAWVIIALWGLVMGVGVWGVLTGRIQ